MAPSKVNKLSDTALGGRCKVCAEPEEKGKRFLICGHSLCMYRYYHIKCMNPGQIASDAQQDNQCWYCPSCLCRTCLSDMDDDQIIMCDGCDEAYHLYCLTPRRTSVPRGTWYCLSCTEAKAREWEVKSYEKRMLKLHRKHNKAMVKSDRFAYADLLLWAAKRLTAEEEEEKLRLKEEAKRLKLEEEEKAIAAEKLRGDEEVATAAE